MNNSEEQYRKEWAAKTGKPESEIYVPKALQPKTLRIVGEDPPTCCGHGPEVVNFTGTEVVLNLTKTGDFDRVVDSMCESLTEALGLRPKE